jgi:hypothetical protein
MALSQPRRQRRDEGSAGSMSKITVTVQLGRFPDELRRATREVDDVPSVLTTSTTAIHGRQHHE